MLRAIQNPRENISQNRISGERIYTSALPLPIKMHELLNEWTKMWKKNITNPFFPNHPNQKERKNGSTLKKKRKSIFSGYETLKMTLFWKSPPVIVSDNILQFTKQRRKKQTRIRMRNKTHAIYYHKLGVINKGIHEYLHRPHTPVQETHNSIISKTRNT